MTSEIAQRIAQLTAKAVAAISGRGPALTREESREAIAALRAQRSGAAAASRAKPAATSRGIAAPIDAKSILKGLGELKK